MTRWIATATTQTLYTRMDQLNKEIRSGRLFPQAKAMHQADVAAIRAEIADRANGVHVQH